MSIKVMSRVWELPLTPPQKLVLLTLADYANDEGICWPTQTSLCARTNLSLRGVGKAISELREMKFLTVSKDGGNKNRYQITVKHLVPYGTSCVKHHVPISEAPRADSNKHHVPISEAPRAAHSLYNHQEPSEEPPRTPNPAAVKKAAPKEDDYLGLKDISFCEFYAIWPRKVSRKEAYSAYRKQVKNPTDHERLMTRTKESISGIFKNRPMRGIPYPATWINSFNWKDDSADLSEPVESKPAPNQHNFMRHDPTTPKLDSAAVQNLDTEDIPF